MLAPCSQPRSNAGTWPLRRGHPSGRIPLRPGVRAKQVWRHLQGRRKDARLNAQLDSIRVAQLMRTPHGLLNIRLGDTIIPWPAKRNRGFTGPYVQPKTTTSHQDDIPASGSQTQTSLATPKSHQRQTSTTTPPRQAINNDIVHRNSTTYGVLVGTDTIALTPIQGTSTTSPRKKRDRHKHKLHSVSYTQSRLRNR